MNEIKYDYDRAELPEGHHLVTKVTVGTIVFDDVLTEDEIISSKGRYNPSGIGECKIEVYSGEGDVPHFHIFSTNKSFNTCVCIYSPNYFAHGDKYSGKFNSKQLKQLDEWLNSPNSEEEKINNWKVIKDSWESMNPSCKFPDYKKTDKSRTIKI